MIYLNAKKKFPVYGQFLQDFNRKGVGMLHAKIGYRGLTKLFDKIEFNYESPITDIKRKYFEIGVSWENPVKKYGNLYFGVNYNNTNIYKDIDEQSKSISVGIADPKYRFELKRIHRQPFLFDNLVDYIGQKYHIPSMKYSIQAMYQLKNNLNMGDIVTGTYSEIQSEVAIPFLSQSQFFKVQYSFKKYYDLFNFSKQFTNRTLK